MLFCRDGGVNVSLASAVVYHTGRISVHLSNKRRTPSGHNKKAKLDLLVIERIRCTVMLVATDHGTAVSLPMIAANTGSVLGGLSTIPQIIGVKKLCLVYEPGFYIYGSFQKTLYQAINNVNELLGQIDH